MIDAARQHEIDRLRIVALEAEVDELQERVRQLEEGFGGGWLPPLELGLSRSEGLVLGALLSREEVITKSALLSIVYSARIDDVPAIKIVDVFICKLRAKLKPFGLVIETRWGIGYGLAPDTRSALKAWPAAGAVVGVAA